MGFLFDLFGELGVMLFFVAVFAGWEYIAYRTSKRVWMWVAGLAGIAVLIWFKGPGLMWSWLLGAGWLGLLAWADRKLHVAAAEAETTSSDAATREEAPLGRPRY
jgi:hypothetical protein